MTTRTAAVAFVASLFAAPAFAQAPRYTNLVNPPPVRRMQVDPVTLAGLVDRQYIYIPREWLMGPTVSIAPYTPPTFVIPASTPPPTWRYYIGGRRGYGYGRPSPIRQPRQ